MADLRKLKQEAAEAVEKGNWRKAATSYANLEKDEPKQPSWALRLGETLRRLGNDREAIKALGRAVEAYAQDGLQLKAIAVCKVILGIDPKHTATLERLASFQVVQRKPSEPAAPPPKPAPPSPATERTWSAPARLTSIPPTALAPPPDPIADVAAPATPPLSGLHLASLVSGARRSRQIPTASGSSAMEIPIGDDDFTPSPSLHKGAGQRTMAKFVLPKTPFFSVLTGAQLRMTVERIRLIQLAAGDTLFSQGDPGDALYVVAWGEVAVLVPQEVARLAEGEFFGEIALIANRPRTATVRATVDSKVLAIDRPLLGDLIAASPDFLMVLLRFVRERLIATLAETSPLFAPFTPLERLGLAARFQFLEIDDGLQLVTEGRKSPGLFVLLAGEAEVSTGGQVIARLESGDVVGEISLIAASPTTATVTCLGKSFVLFLPRADFTELMMTHPQVLEYVSSVAESRARDGGRLTML
jgi:CRP-like cAMP-binding protein